VAEDVEKVNPDLVVRDQEGKPYSVRYEQINAMLLNEFLKEHRKGEQQDRKIEGLETTVAQLQSVLKEQAARIEKVSDQLAVSKSAPQIVLGNQ
jgi:predicted RNase H-like nuclease (RuvC/YqgF family)